jgi:hypothetical protein
MSAPVVQEPTSICSSYVGARRGRTTLVDRCGRTTYGPKSSAAFGGFVSVEFSPEVEEGEDFSTKDIAGDWCVVGKGDDMIKWIATKLTFCRVDADVFYMMNRSWKLNVDAQGRSSGFRIGQKLSSAAGFALEIWPKSAPGAVACDDDADENADPGGYILLPWNVATAPDSWTLENGTASFALNARTIAGSRWGVGPYDVIRQVDGSAGPLLVPIDDGRVSGDPDLFYYDFTDVAPPPAACGALPLSNPTGPVFTVEDVVGEPLQREFTPPGAGGPYTLDPGDGTAPVPLPALGVIHEYAEPGVYYPSVYVTATPQSVTFQRIEVAAA